MAYASMVFNGSNEDLRRTLSTTSPTVTQWTLSYWAKVAASQGGPVYDVSATNINEYVGFDTDSNTVYMGYFNNDTEYGEYQNSAFTDSIWQHWVIVYDTPNGSAASRFGIYRSGSLLTPTGADNPTSSLASLSFANGRLLKLGSNMWDDYYTGKLAFMDFVQGAALAPTAFAEDRSGTWTRIPYAGSYGTYGWSLTGHEGIGQDSSGNGLHFTPTNMDASNLDTGDLPPHDPLPGPPGGLVGTTLSSAVFGRTFRRL